MIDFDKDEVEKQKSMTPERAKELEEVAVVYAVDFFPGGKPLINKGVLLDVGPNRHDRERVTALLAVDATVGDVFKDHKNFDTLLITNWNYMFEHEEGAKAYIVNALKRRNDVINKEIKKYS